MSLKSCSVFEASLNSRICMSLNEKDSSHQVWTLFLADCDASACGGGTMIIHGKRGSSADQGFHNLGLQNQSSAGTCEVHRQL